MNDKHVWTKEKPTQDGWYWGRSKGYLEICKIEGEVFHVNGFTLPLAEADGIFWAGPIKNPVEQEMEENQ